MKTLDPISNEFTIPVPNGATEFEVHAELFVRLRDLGFDVRGEVNWKSKKKEAGRKMTCRFDLVVYDDGKPAHIIEIKSAPIDHRDGLENTRQGRRYRMFGVPVTFVYGMEEARAVIDLLKLHA